VTRRRTTGGHGRFGHDVAVPAYADDVIDQRRTRDPAPAELQARLAEDLRRLDEIRGLAARVQNAERRRLTARERRNTRARPARSPRSEPAPSSAPRSSRRSSSCSRAR
jgi:hypothetical protein